MTVADEDIRARTEQLNRDCFCVTLDRRALADALDRETGSAGFADKLSDTHRSLFSAVPVFVPDDVLRTMTKVVAAVEATAQLPQYRAQSLAAAPASAQRDFGPAGVLMGYDFHVTPTGPGLIEINTNAGGAFLNALAQRAQKPCCTSHVAFAAERGVEDKLFEMFVADWRRQKGSGRPSTIAIVDDAPETQFLYPEFQLAKALLEKRGIATIIADAAELSWDGATLTHRGRAIDFVYNRVVDFAFDEPRHSALREAYLSGNVVVTPNPHVHALLADKRNLAVLSDAALLQSWGLPPEYLDVLRTSVPRTYIVSPANADALWEMRRTLFFKPARGHASKAAYRGEKITRKVWAEILEGDYVAQSYVPPSARRVQHEQTREDLKVDVRIYTYAGEPLLAAARLYQGQTTNMRTPGGGFAAVLAAPCPLENTRACG